MLNVYQLLYIDLTFIKAITLTEQIQSKERVFPAHSFSLVECSSAFTLSQFGLKFVAGVLEKAVGRSGDPGSSPAEGGLHQSLTCC